MAAIQGKTIRQIVRELREFFREVDAREKGHEPDWEEHLAVMARSRASGGSGT